MNALTARDKQLLIVFVLVAMIGVLGLWFPKAKAAWKAEQLRLANNERRLAREEMMLNARPILFERYEELRNLMPIFPEGRAVDTYWLPIMDNSAKANDVNIAQRSIGGETPIGEVTELTLECRDWTARLDSLVWFLYDLETRKDAMMDIRALTIRPSTKNPGYLQGTFTLNCAYMRQAATASNE